GRLPARGVLTTEALLHNSGGLAVPEGGSPPSQGLPECFGNDPGRDGRSVQRVQLSELRVLQHGQDQRPVRSPDGPRQRPAPPPDRRRVQLLIIARRGPPVR